MDTAIHEEDLKLAQETCEELQAGNNDAILSLYNRYKPFFLGYTCRRLADADDQAGPSIVDDFWVELLNARAICDYKGLAALKTYLFRILNFRIVDSLRKDETNWYQLDKNTGVERLYVMASENKIEDFGERVEKLKDQGIDNIEKVFPDAAVKTFSFKHE